MAIVYYFDVINGDDSNDGTSKDKPLKNLSSFLDTHTFDNETILSLNAGTYLISSYKWLAKIPDNGTLIFLGIGEKTTIEATCGWYPNAGGGKKGTKVKFRKMKWTTNGRTWTNAFYVVNDLYFENVYFYDFGAPSYDTFLTYRGSNFYFTNCISVTKIPLRAYDNGKVYVTNSYGNFVMSSYGNLANCYVSDSIITTDPKVDSSYHILDTPNKNIGVKAGAYAWISYFLKSEKGEFYTVSENRLVKIKNFSTEGIINLNQIFDIDKKYIKIIQPFKIIALCKTAIKLTHKQSENFILAKINNNVHLTFKARFLLSNDLKEWYNYYDEKEYSTISFKDKSEIPKYINENCKFISTVTNEYKYMLIKAEDLYDNYTLYKCAFPDCYLTNENDIFLQDGKILINQKHTYKKMHVCKTNDSSEYLDSIEVIK